MLFRIQFQDDVEESPVECQQCQQEDKQRQAVPVRAPRATAPGGAPPLSGAVPWYRWERCRAPPRVGTAASEQPHGGCIRPVCRQWLPRVVVRGLRSASASVLSD